MTYEEFVSELINNYDYSDADARDYADEYFNKED